MPLLILEIRTSQRGTKVTAVAARKTHWRTEGGDRMSLVLRFWHYLIDRPLV